MRRTLLLLLAMIMAGRAAAADCPGNPAALGVSRTIVVDPTEHPLLGGLQYDESLPLNDREVVLTFDDGPLPAYTTRILNVLASECVKATFFMVGRMAQAYPQVVKRVAIEGHTVANHSQTHPFTFHKMGIERATREIQDGFTSIRAALGDSGEVAPFFRIPGLLRQESVEQYLAAEGVMTWSVDAVADDWRHINNKEIVRRAINRLEAKGRGILLLHDIQPATALALPSLLAELKARGFKIVHVIPASANQPKTVTAPEQWALRQEPPGIWPRVAPASLLASEPVLEVPSPQSFGASAQIGAAVPVALVAPGEKLRVADTEIELQPLTPWPDIAVWPVMPDVEVLPVPAENNFHYVHVWRQHALARNVHASSPRKTLASTASARRTGNLARRNARPKDHEWSPVWAPPAGHQIQLPKPTAETPPRGRPTAGLFGHFGIIR
jgi:peptidoglycan/xylan/chitin deacetylase (PgdA/CDA1 family)